MSSADKFELFLKICGVIFSLLFVLKIFSVISVSWWIIFLPIIIPTILILKELGAFKKN